LVKSKDDMAKYYDRNRTPAPDYKPGDKVYLDASDIRTTRPSKKTLPPQTGPFLHHKESRKLRLSSPTSAINEQATPGFQCCQVDFGPRKPIEGRQPHPPPPPELIDGEEEYIVEEILDSKMMNKKLRYLVKWEGYGVEHNSWEPWDNIHAPEHITDFHRKHPGAARHIRRVISTPFLFDLFYLLGVSGRHSLEGGVDVRGHPTSPPTSPPNSDVYHLRHSTSFDSLPYIPPYRRHHP